MGNTVDGVTEPSVGDACETGVGWCEATGLCRGGDRGVVRVVAIDLLAIETHPTIRI